MHLPLPFYHSIKIAQENSSSVHKDTGRVCYTFIKSFRLKGACSLYEPTRLCRTFPQKTVISLLVLAALTGIIVLLFKDNWAEITAALSQLSAWQVLVVLAIGLSYPLLEGCVAWGIVRSRIPGFRLWQGIDTAWCGTFGNVVTLGAGAVPVQTWYLHRCGLPVGPGVGLMTLQYVFHKTTVLLYATVMLLFQHRWLAANTTGVMNYLPMAYAVVAAIIVVLVLVCVSPLVQNLARWLMRLLPKTEKWQQRRADWQQQLDVLGEESRRLLADKPRCAEILALQAVKLFGLFCLPYLCIRFMGLSPLSFLQVQLLTSLMLFCPTPCPMWPAWAPSRRHSCWCSAAFWSAAR